MAQNHEKLQSEAHIWLHNTYPKTRGLSHANFNNLPSALERTLPAAQKIQLMMRLKAVGLVKGVLDYEFFWSGRLYAFDFKIGSDKLSKDQLEYISSLVENGGVGCEIRSLDQFKLEIESILNNGCLTSEL